MKNLLKKVAEISKKYQHLAEASGSNFNVFKVINVTTDEVRLHSRFIAELLNPEGSHGQQDVFLKLFTEIYKIEIDTKGATVEVEKHVGTVTDTTGGFIDIFISDNRGRAITIENKIYASDQKSQLLRYYKHNENNLFYLTLFGNEPAKYSYEFDDKNKLDPEKDFKLISYKYDIKDWLVACRKEAVELPLLREGISHYLNLIETLTGQSSNDIMNKEITDSIVENKESLKNASLIAENLTAAKIKIQWLFWKSLKEKLEKKLKENELDLINEKNVSWQNVRSYYQDSRNKDRNYGFMVKIFHKGDISIHFGIEVDHKIFFGFTIEDDKKGGISNQEKYSDYKNLVQEINPNYKNHEYWLGWRYTEEILDFRAFNTDAVFNLADRKILDATTTTITTDVINDINQLKAKLENI
ncbi:PD-(D/E)XK nuclease family protein [Olleya sp. 1-3]|uniref:PDDEXK-like family protein n=1 Tax=Olleya sp. 1-3 TaxID=2058323 RepID=UPI000C327C50|nr:PD-(D/E)XK nuclease family protein [Olleya sp. 1-3]PKG52343.1 hypothetical protein CXF54_04540 [Olleya sp. 1-3]